MYNLKYTSSRGKEDLYGNLMKLITGSVLALPFLWCADKTQNIPQQGTQQQIVESINNARHTTIDNVLNPKWVDEKERELNMFPTVKSVQLYAVQVGSFYNPENAAKFAKTFENIGYYSFLKEKKTKNKSPIYQVGILTYTKKASEEFKKNISKNVCKSPSIFGYSKISLKIYNEKEMDKIIGFYSKEYNIEKRSIDALIEAESNHSQFPIAFKFYYSCPASNKKCRHRQKEKRLVKRGGVPIISAIGFAQPSPKYAKEHGVDKIDMFNPWVSAFLGMEHLKGSFKQFDGNAIYAVAAYNCGPNNVEKIIKKIKETRQIEDISSDEFKKEFLKALRDNKGLQETFNFVCQVMNLGEKNK